MSEHTSFYEKIGITPLINASETYTNLGGSLMDERTVEAMRQAGEHFVDYPLPVSYTHLTLPTIA